MKFNFNKIVVVSGVLALTALSAFAGYYDSWRVTVQSDDYGWRLMRMPTDRPIRLVKRISKAGCDYGRSWGITNRGIWVDHGCRAVFQVAGNHPRDWHAAWEKRRHDGDADITFRAYGDHDFISWHN